MMMRQASVGDFCIEGRSSCLEEDERLSPSHFDLCPTKFYPPSAPQRPRQVCFAYLPPPAPVLKGPACQRPDCSQGPVPPRKKTPATGKSGKRGRPQGTTKLAGYRTSTGRPLGTTKAAGFKTSPGRPLGTTKAAGYKVSPGRPPGSIRSQTRISKLSYSSTAAFPYSSIKPEESALKEEERRGTPKMLLQAPPFLLSGFPLRTQRSSAPADGFVPDSAQTRPTLSLPLPSFS